MSKILEFISENPKKKKSNNSTSTYSVTGMTCAGCVSSVEEILQKQEDIEEAEVNFATETVRIKPKAGASAEKWKKALQDMGYDMLLDVEDPNEMQSNLQEARYQTIKKRTLLSAFFTIPVFIIGMFFMEWEAGRWLSMGLSVPVLFIFGRHFFVNAYKQARNGKANMDTLVALSTGIAFVFSAFNTIYPEFWTVKEITPHVYYEAAVVIITFISFGKMLEEKAKSNTSSAIQKLMGLQAKTVRRVRGEQVEEIAVTEVMKGDILLVRPGDKVPLDGNVCEGSSFVDESLISGEPIPIEKQKGDAVIGGTLNQKGSFRFEVEKIGKETLLSQIIARVREAQGSKAPVQKLVDKIAGIFVPIVLIIAILTFIVWFFVADDNAFSQALLTSIAVLVIACPCALGLATPTAIMVGIGKGAENQILVKDAQSLEIGRQVNALILDKTGTITEGKPSVSHTFWAGETAQKAKYESIIKAMESRSEHPLATAMLTEISEQIKAHSLDNFESLTGMGVQAQIENKTYFIGNRKLLDTQNIKTPDLLAEKAKKWQASGQTVVYFADEQSVLATFAIADKIKPSSANAIQTLQKQGIELYMLTGDNLQTAQAVAQEVGIANFKAEQLPSDKADFVKKLQQQGKVVAMVGDGINDSEALAQADMSIAMGTGSDIAMDVAKVTLITADLRLIAKAFSLSRQTIKGLRQNLFWAFIYNLIGIPIAAGVLYPINGFLLDPMIAGAAMALSSVSVVLNSLRLRNIKL
ncbi:MAG: copper-translocating P-type ATPase [Bernardetiaceae bacterium]|nr:copper-translocating P-type ATPase [Bernardetiaceae bacterium]